MRPTFDYEDFSLRIDGQGDQFRARLVRSPFGPREEPFLPPYTSNGLISLLSSVERALTRIGSSAEDQSVRALGSGKTSTPDSTNPQSVGNELFKSLFRDSILQCFFQSLSHVESRPYLGLRICLELDPAQPRLAELGALPWELMYRAESRDYLSRNLLTPLVRYLNVSHLQTGPPPIQDRLRILVLVSSPRGLPPLDHERELERIQSAWGARPDIRIIKPERPTLRTLRRLLRDTRPDVLHFIGHGAFDASTGHGSLAFEDAERRAHPVTGSLLAETLKTGHRIRLVFLNSCEGGRLPRRKGQDPYHGVASALLMGGVASVVSMQYPVSDQAAVVFSDAFYSALAAGDPIESAVAEGRLSVFQEMPSSWEWATPALYMSAANGRIFQPLGHDSALGSADETMRLAEGLGLRDMNQSDAAIDESSKILKISLREPNITLKATAKADEMHGGISTRATHGGIVNERRSDALVSHRIRSRSAIVPLSVLLLVLLVLSLWRLGRPSWSPQDLLPVDPPPPNPLETRSRRGSFEQTILAHEPQDAELLSIWQNAKSRSRHMPLEVAVIEGQSDSVLLSATGKAIHSDPSLWKITSKRDALERIALYIIDNTRTMETAKAVFLKGGIRDAHYSSESLTANVTFEIEQLEVNSP